MISTLEEDGARWTGITDVTEMPSNKLYVLPLLYDDDSSFTPHMLSSTFNGLTVLLERKIGGICETLRTRMGRAYSFEKWIKIKVESNCSSPRRCWAYISPWDEASSTIFSVKNNLVDGGSHLQIQIRDKPAYKPWQDFKLDYRKRNFKWKKFTFS